ncbi:MAG: 50S ribosomal protein L10 [bacterium]|nr:50S ribosomal protein L10 [bacterium]
MKSKTQKQKELKKGKEVLAKSQALIFADFSKITVNDLKKLRRELGALDSNLVVMKKRLLSILLKEKGIEFDTRTSKASIGTVFSSKHFEEICGPVVKFFSGLENIKASERILGGFDIKGNVTLEANKVVMVGNLPPREILLAQLFGMVSAPISSLLYLLQEKSKKVESSTA